jgi:hydroxymethylpyrimidine pyrophosphatase-like HAD family hydrolase
MSRYFERVIPGTGLDLYSHPDCFDVLPSGISKGSAVKLICSILNINPKDAASVGDHTNDYPMFAGTGMSIGISLEDPTKAKISVKNLKEALNHLLRSCKQ